MLVLLLAVNERDKASWLQPQTQVQVITMLCQTTQKGISMSPACPPLQHRCQDLTAYNLVAQLVKLCQQARGTKQLIPHNKP
jgi:hypothetical protein